jgi:peptidoglycan/LPS O-acetylase OafA/YrhL
LEIRKLNSLRGIAALIVVISHYFDAAISTDHLLAGRAGQLGVMIFFILSGFLMSYLYMNKNFDRPGVRQYLVYRVARIVPLFVIVVFASFILSEVGLKNILYPIENVSMLMSHIMLLWGVSVLWTIPTEIHFYLGFILVWYVFQRNAVALWVTLAAIYAGVIFLNYPLFVGELYGISYSFLVVRSLPYFFVGLIMGQLYITWAVPERLKSHWFVISLLLILFLYPNVFEWITGYEHKTWSEAAILVALTVIFFAVVFLVPDDNPILANRWGDILGSCSYSLYMLHLPILKQLTPLAQNNPWLFLPVFLSLAILLSYFSYRLIESPCRRIIRERYRN